MAMEEQYMTAGKAAEALGTTRVTLRRLIKEGQLPAERDPVDRRVLLIPVSAIEKLRRRYEGRKSGPKARRVA